MTKADLITPYAQDLVGKIRTACGGQEKPLTGLNIIVDAGNGAGGFLLRKFWQNWEQIPLVHNS